MSQEIKPIQHELNLWVKKYLRGVAPLIVDGKRGHATGSRIKWVKWYLGYGKGAKDNSADITSKFVRSLRHPHSLRYNSPRALAAAFSRRRHQRAEWKAHQAHAVSQPGVTTYDGVPVAKCAVPILNWCRGHGWHGRLVSGYRSPEYSDSLCRRMCGAPRCPGLCAGRASNHSGNSPSRFAVDVSDYYTFGSVVARCPLSPHIHNALPRDRVHYSPSGN